MSANCLAVKTSGSWASEVFEVADDIVPADCSSANPSPANPPSVDVDGDRGGGLHKGKRIVAGYSTVLLLDVVQQPIGER